MRPLAPENWLDEALDHVRGAERGDGHRQAGAPAPGTPEPRDRGSGSDPAQTLAEVGQGGHVPVPQRRMGKAVDRAIKASVDGLRQDPRRFDGWPLHPLMNAYSR